jgi:hypothetical protein
MITQADEATGNKNLQANILTEENLRLLPVAYCRLPIAGCLLPVAYCRLLVACCLLPVA